MNTFSSKPAASSSQTDTPSDSLEHNQPCAKKTPTEGVTYARARLWLGITGVGTLVVGCATLLATGATASWFYAVPELWWRELGQLAIFFGAYATLMLPLDWLGGYLFPLRYGRCEQKSQEWWSIYLRGAGGQILFFCLASLALLNLGRWWGPILGGGAAIVCSLLAWSVVRAVFLQRRLIATSSSDHRLKGILNDCRRWGIEPAPVWIVRHRDPGFSGGIVAVGGQPRIVIPESWLALPSTELAAAIARRSLIISSRGFWQGSLSALMWNVAGFSLSAIAPGGGLDTVAHLVGTMCWYTLWSFLGLLILPTFSRNAALAFDQQLIDRRVPPETLSQLASSLDRKQDDEPTRGAWVEAIFHPFPSVANRLPNRRPAKLQLWNMARNSLALSWPMCGLLARAVHCNVGRPELWVILPTD